MIIKQIDPYMVDARPVLCEKCEEKRLSSNPELQEEVEVERAEWIIIESDRAIFLCPFHALNSIYAAIIERV